MPDARYPLDIVFELVDLGAAMVAARFRREHPDATDAEVEAAVNAWLGDRSMAPNGDAEGRLVTWPRPPRTGPAS